MINLFSHLVGPHVFVGDFRAPILLPRGLSEWLPSLPHTTGWLVVWKGARLDLRPKFSWNKQGHTAWQHTTAAKSALIKHHQQELVDKGCKRTHHEWLPLQKTQSFHHWCLYSYCRPFNTICMPVKQTIHKPLTQHEPQHRHVRCEAPRASVQGNQVATSLGGSVSRVESS